MKKTIVAMFPYGIPLMAIQKTAWVSEEFTQFEAGV
jgi:hypothetical protein